MHSQIAPTKNLIDIVKAIIPPIFIHSNGAAYISDIALIYQPESWIYFYELSNSAILATIIETFDLPADEIMQCQLATGGYQLRVEQSPELKNKLMQLSPDDINTLTADFSRIFINKTRLRALRLLQHIDQKAPVQVDKHPELFAKRTAINFFTNPQSLAAAFKLDRMLNDLNVLYSQLYRAPKLANVAEASGIRLLSKRH